MRPQSIEGKNVVLRAIAPSDRAVMRTILADESVARWWGTGSPDKAADDLYGDDAVAYAIVVEGEVAGAIQYNEEDEPDYRHAAIDIFLGRAFQGRGLGSDAVRTLARYLFDVVGHHRLTIDPALANERAIAAYKRVGFRPVGVMRKYERGPDGTWHDGLLMDMLADELTDG